MDAILGLIPFAELATPDFPMAEAFILCLMSIPAIVIMALRYGR